MSRRPGLLAAAEYPVGALAYLHARHLTGNLALPLDWGGYALGTRRTGIRVSLDGRFATVYPPRVVEDNFAFFRGDADPAAGRLLDATIPRWSRPTRRPDAHAGRPQWRLLYTDEVAALYGTTGCAGTSAATARLAAVPVTCSALPAAWCR